PEMDMTDLYVFPSPTAGRVVLAMNSWGVLSPAQTPTTYFDPNILYQFKVDNNADGIEDRVIQVTFSGYGASQQVQVRGPVAPPVVGAMMNRVASSTPTLTGAPRTSLGSTGGMQVYAGPREDPFFIDLEQFFRIIPDRKPVTGPLSQLPDTPSASAWRNPGIDFLAGFNVLSIIIELPVSDLTGSSGPRFGVWATMSR
ncbi:MAG: DUF4331 family protein, partial [Gemmatimonadales bacterium]